MSLFADQDAALPRNSVGDWVQAHCDGGSRGNPGPAGFGATISDSGGRPLAELSQFLGVRSNNFAEYAGLLAVLAWALEHGYRRLRVVSDSELMVRQIQGRYKVNSPDLKPLWQQARMQIAKLDSFEIAHALRRKNKAADALANAAMDRGMGRESGSQESGKSSAPRPEERKAAMLRGFTRAGEIHLLGSERLPDGIFVKIIPE